MEDVSLIESRWQDIEDSRPRDRTKKPKEGSTGFAFLMWANNTVERVRVLSRDRHGKINIMRMVPSVTQHTVEMGILRSEAEILRYLQTHHPDELKNLDITRLPRGIQMKIWGR